MREERLYINGELVDIDENTNIAMSIKSNLLVDVSKMTSNNTYTIKLPKTARNQKILRHVDLVQTQDIYAYQMHKARFFRGGVELIKDGRATVLQVTESSIEISIIWGLFPKFSSILSEGVTLNQLESDDKILYKNSNVLSTYEDALKASYFYAGYDVYRHEKKVDDTWKSSELMVHPIVTTTFTGTFGGSRASGSNGGNENLHPVVKASWVLELIKKCKGVDFLFDDVSKRYIDTLIIPLINKKSNELTYVGSFKAKLLATNAKGAITIEVTEKSSVFNAEVGARVTTLKVVGDASLILDVRGGWEFDVTGAVLNGTTGKMDSTGNITYYDRYMYRYGYYLRVTVKYGGDIHEYIIGDTREHCIAMVPAGYRGMCRYTYEGKGRVEVKDGGEVTFEWLNPIDLKGASFTGGEVKVLLSSSDDVPSGGYYPIAYNLPKIKIIDYVKFLAAITGTFPLQMSNDNVVRFVPLSIVWQKRDEARDWTKRLIAYGNENKPQNIEFNISNYGQNNLYRWKEDDETKGNYDGNLKIENETLDVEKVIFDFPFAATDGNNVPMYDEIGGTSTSTTGDGRFGGSRSDSTTVDGTTVQTSTSDSSYSACKDRILQLTKGAANNAQAIFNINMQEIINEKYRNVAESLQNAKVIKEKILIKNMELAAFDETKPVYLSQYGAYFAVLELSTNGNGMAEATMLQLNF